MKYAAVGLPITNDILYTDGSTVSKIVGGSTYGVEGLRLWDDDAGFIANVGEDFYDIYGDWVRNNHIPTEGIHIMHEHTPYTLVTYKEDGDWSEASIYTTEFHDEYLFGYLGVRGEDVDAIAPGLKGLNVERDCDLTFFKHIKQLKDKYGFKVMWEISSGNCIPQNLEKIKEICTMVDCFSINGREAERTFGVKGDEACIAALQTLPVAFTLFRVGEKGLYAVTPTDAWFVPCRRYNGPVCDPTGCGNSSTATALWAYAEGYDPLMIGIMSNLTAHYNVRQYGPVLDMSKELRQEMMDAAKAEYAAYKK